MSGYRNTDIYMPERLSGCFIGGGSQSSKNQSQQGPVENPAFPMLQGNVQRATSIADMPFQSYVQRRGRHSSGHRSLGLSESISEERH